MTGLETSYAALNTVLPNLSAEQVSTLFSLNARKIFNLPAAEIKEGETADITLFNNDGDTQLTNETTKVGR